MSAHVYGMVVTGFGAIAFTLAWFLVLRYTVGDYYGWGALYVLGALAIPPFLFLVMVGVDHLAGFYWMTLSIGTLGAVVCGWLLA